MLRRADDGGVARGAQPAGRHSALENLGRAGLIERKLGGIHAFDGGLADVVDTHLGAAIGESDSQGEADVATPPDDNHVPVELVAQRRTRHPHTSATCKRMCRLTAWAPTLPGSLRVFRRS